MVCVVLIRLLSCRSVTGPPRSRHPGLVQGVGPNTLGAGVTCFGWENGEGHTDRLRTWVFFYSQRLPVIVFCFALYPEHAGQHAGILASDVLPSHVLCEVLFHEWTSRVPLGQLHLPLLLNMGSF